MKKLNELIIGFIETGKNMAKLKRLKKEVEMYERRIIVEKIMSERDRQNGKFGEQNHEPTFWVSIITEEIGEAAKEANDYQLNLMDIHSEFDPVADMQNIIRLRDELIQVAAVAVNAIESIERNEIKELREFLIDDNTPKKGKQ